MRRVRTLPFRRRLLVQSLETRTVPTVFTVTTLADGPVAGPGQLPGSLRQAIFDANADVNPDADVINFAAGLMGTITLSAGEYQILAKDLTINGPGSGKLTIDAANNSRGFQINDFVPLTQIKTVITGLKVTNGKSLGFAGGGIFIDDENVTLNDVVVTNCTTDVEGGGIAAIGVGAKLTLNNCSITGNTANDASLVLYPSGGGAYFYGAQLNISNSTISMNTASGGAGTSALASGGGLAFSGDTPAAAISISNTQINNNTAGRGGGIFSFNIAGKGASCSVSLVNSSITGNKAVGNAGGTYGGAGAYIAYVGKFILQGCTVSGNQTSGKADGSDFCAGGGLQIVLTNGGDTTLGKFGADLLNSTIANNVSTGRGGGASIFQLAGNNMPVTVANCVITGNSASGTTNGLGGGLDLGSTAMIATIDSCQITGNSAFIGGSGVENQGGGATITIQNTTIANNSALDPLNGRGAGVGMFGWGAATNTLTVRNSTIAFNTSVGTDVTSTAAAGGIYTSPGDGATGPTVLVESSIIVGNTTGGGTGKLDMSSSLVGITMKNSAIGVSDNVVFLPASANNFKGTQAMPETAASLGLSTTLALNGSTTTQTLALLAGSKAINAGSNPGSLMFDQRGTGFLRTVNGGTDMGAFEVQAAVAPPTVTSVVVNGGDAQRSLVTSIAVTFSEPVTLMAGAIQLNRYGPSGPTGLVNLVLTPSGNTVNITFTSGGTIGVDPGNSLQDGQYELTIFASKVTGAGGNMAMDVTSKTWRLFGDGNGDGQVNTDDFAAFRTAFGTPSTIFDFSGNGVVDTDDFAAFRTRFGLTGYMP